VGGDAAETSHGKWYGLEERGEKFKSILNIPLNGIDSREKG
jgi:hypothetical protein